MGQSRPALISMTLPALSLAGEFEAALAWWRAAGVTHHFTDDATAWLADEPLSAAAAQSAAGAATGRMAPTNDQPREAAPARLAAVPAAPAAVSRRNWLGDSPPADLAAFRQWWMTAPDLDSIGRQPRIPARGAAGAALMVLVPHPEAEDRERLLEGPQGRLLNNICAALGLNDDAVYLAAALPCHLPMADLAGLGAGGMDAVLAHHIALAAPQRVLALGTGLAPWLTRIKDEPLRAINQTVVNTPVMVSEALDAMMDVPRLKARFWKRWIEWSAQ